MIRFRFKRAKDSASWSLQGSTAAIRHLGNFLLRLLLLVFAALVTLIVILAFATPELLLAVAEKSLGH